MRTGSGSKPAVRNGDSLRARRLRFGHGRMMIVLDDGREVSVPLKWYPALQHASAAQRARWEILGDGRGFYWPALDLDLSTYGLVNGIREGIPRPPALSEISAFKTLKRRSA